VVGFEFAVKGSRNGKNSDETSQPKTELQVNPNVYWGLRKENN